MADQKTEDTKSPLARRGSRPFAGPGTAPSAARPFLRPATPSQRPTAAPFVPPVVPTRPALGASEPATKAPVPTGRPTPAVVRVAAPVVVSAPAAPVVMAAPGGLPEPEAQPEPTPVVSAMPTPDNDPFFGNATATSEAEEPASKSRPITTEMIALDAFDAFDAVWASPERHDTAEQRASASPLDETALGSALDAQHPWAEDITAGGESASTSEPSASEPAHPTPGFAMPAWLADDAAPASSASPEPAATHEEQETVESEPSHWPIVASDYAYSTTDWADTAAIPAAADISPPDLVPDDVVPAEPLASLGEPSIPALAPPPIDQTWAESATAAVEQFNTMPAPEPLAVPAERPRFELVEERPIAEHRFEPPVADPRLVHRLRMSGALDRLAQRVRDGEIDVASIAPEATDPAVLASVLAALLGGSSSR